MSFLLNVTWVNRPHQLVRNVVFQAPPTSLLGNTRNLIRSMNNSPKNLRNLIIWFPPQAVRSGTARGIETIRKWRYHLQGERSLQPVSKSGWAQFSWWGRYLAQGRESGLSASIRHPGKEQGRDRGKESIPSGDDSEIRASFCWQVRWTVCLSGSDFPIAIQKGRRARQIENLTSPKQ